MHGQVLLNNKTMFDMHDPQAPYNEVRFSIIGDDQAPNFFRIVETTGVIELASSLNEDSAEVYRVSALKSLENISVNM